jgi:hypothetical protein
LNATFSGEIPLSGFFTLTRQAPKVEEAGATTVILMGVREVGLTF